MAFTIKIEPEAKQDIQNGITWYNQQKSGLGSKFHSSIKAHLVTLRTTPFHQIRYDHVHCLPLKKFPYMIHYTVDEENQKVIVHGVFNTARNPKIWKTRK